MSEHEARAWRCTNAACDGILGTLYVEKADLHLNLPDIERVCMNPQGTLSVQHHCGWWSMWVRGAEYQTPTLRTLGESLVLTTQVIDEMRRQGVRVTS